MGDIQKLSFKEFYEQSHQGLFASLRKSGISTEDGKDIIQEVMEEMLQIYKKHNESFGTIQNPIAYAHSVLINRVLRLRRSALLEEKVQQQLALERIGFFHNPESLAETRDMLIQISKILSRVDEAPRLCFTLFKEGYSIKEISDRMNIPISTVYHYKRQVESLIPSVISTK